MTRRLASFTLAALVSAGLHAATYNTTLTVTNATGSFNASGGLTATSSQVNLTTIGTGSFTGTLSLTPDTSQNLTGTFTITVSTGTTGTITGTLKIPASALTGTLTGSATVTGGTGNFTGATGSFPNLTGSLSIGLSISLTITGAGTINTGGTGGGGGPTAPTVTAVLDAASNTPNIPQGGIFIVKGSNLSASGYTPFSPPRPTTSNGVKVTFTPVTGGSGTDAYLVYLYNLSNVNQIACILPSTVPVGNYNVTATNGTASAPFLTQVVANKLGLFTQDSTGTGLASAQNYISAGVVDLNRLTTGTLSGITISPAKPGQPVIAYGTGLGAYAAGDNDASKAAFDFRSSLTITAVVGGVTIPVDYAGLAGYPGEDQINFTLPTNIPTGCAVTLQISVNGKLSPPTSISIAPDANSSACVFPGFTTAQLQKLDQGGTITTGAFSITQFAITTPQGNAKTNSIGGGFTQLNGYQLASAAQVNVSVIQSGSCQVITGSSSGGSASTGSLTYLDAGTVTINGPSGSSLSNQALTKTNNSYSLSSFEGISLPGQANFSLLAGTYSLAGAGGADVGTFNTSLTLASPLTVTGGLPSTVVRSSPLTINWTGGNASDLVEIIGGSSTTTGSGSSAITNSTTFICLTTAGKGTFTVPTSILSQLSATTTGILEVASGNNQATFTATLKADGSSIPGTFGSFLGTGNTPAYQ